MKPKKAKLNPHGHVMCCVGCGRETKATGGYCGLAELDGEGGVEVESQGTST